MRDDHHSGARRGNQLHLPHHQMRDDHRIRDLPRPRLELNQYGNPESDEYGRTARRGNQLHLPHHQMRDDHRIRDLSPHRQDDDGYGEQETDEFGRIVRSKIRLHPPHPQMRDDHSIRDLSPHRQDDDGYGEQETDEFDHSQMVDDCHAKQLRKLQEDSRKLVRKLQEEINLYKRANSDLGTKVQSLVAEKKAGINANLKIAATVTPTRTVLETPGNNAFNTILIHCADEITKATTNSDKIEIVRSTLQSLIYQSRKEIQERNLQETRSQDIASKSWRKGHNKGNRTLINQLEADIVVYNAFLGVLSELSDELFNELSSTSSQRVQFLQMDKMFLDDPVKFVQRVRAQHLNCRELYVPKSVSMKFSSEIMQYPMVVTLLCMLYGAELLCNRDSKGWCPLTKLHNE